MTIRWVAQEDSYGCGAAAVAMLTGQTYAEVKAYTALQFDKQGMSSTDWGNVLAEFGYALALLYRVRQYPWRNGERDIWPPLPWADAHLCEVIVRGGSGGSHLVIMLGDGSVLDPLGPEPRQLSDYAAVFMVAAVVPAPRPAAALLAVHRQPEMEG